MWYGNLQNNPTNFGDDQSRYNFSNTQLKTKISQILQEVLQTRMIDYAPKEKAQMRPCKNQRVSRSGKALL